MKRVVRLDYVRKNEKDQSWDVSRKFLSVLHIGDEYNGFAIYKDIETNGITFAITKDAKLWYIFDGFIYEEVLDAIDNYADTGEFGFLAYNVSKINNSDVSDGKEKVIYYIDANSNGNVEI